jgi:tetratricopeptide (TPR) repeat protein
METPVKAPLGFVQRRLPWIVAGVALLVYGVTLTRWARSDSMGTLSSVMGWGLYLPVQAPLLHLLARPFRLLPGGIQAGVLNGLAAVSAALVLALLARAVALLPYDRTLASRLREPGPLALLSHPLAWLPVVLACLACGLQRTFWEHATALTGEMLDLLVFAYLIRCVLEYRIDRRDRWLLKMAFVYGLGVTNNYALVAFFPLFLAAVVGVKSWEFLRLRFLAGAAGLGLVGLLLYLYLPLTGLAEGDVLGSFRQHLKAVLGSQWGSLRRMPPWVVLMLAFTSVVPTILLSIRWAGAVADSGTGAQTIVALVLRGLQVVLVFGCFSVFFDPPWSARVLGRGLAFLPLYYVAALCVGYCAGYFLVMTRSSVGKGWPLPPGLIERMGPLAPGLAVTVLVAVPSVLLARNWGPVRLANSAPLGRLADQMAAALPVEGAYVFGDMVDDLLLVEARVRHTLGRSPHVFAYTRWLDSPEYQARLNRRYGPRWPFPTESVGTKQPLGDKVLLEQMVSLARSNVVFYLNPSFGAHFELLRLRPVGLAWQAEVVPPAPVIPRPWTDRELEGARKFWEAAEPGLEAVSREKRVERAERYPEIVYSRALNDWGVTLQRRGEPKEAGRWFDWACRVNTNNAIARVNRIYNQGPERAGAPAVSGEVPGLPRDRTVWETLRLLNGPVDQPQWTAAAGQAFAQGGFCRQAAIEFDRLSVLAPDNPSAALWRDTLEAMTRLRFGDVAGAERQMLGLQATHPTEEIVFESLARLYMVSGRLTNALESVDGQLQLNPTNVNALLNKSALHIQLRQFPAAIAAADKLLALQPRLGGGRLNRAIACLQSDRLDEAQRDYEEALRAMPRSADVHFGLGEIARRKKDTATAMEHFQQYLEYGQPGTAEFKMVARRVEELRGGGGER